MVKNTANTMRQLIRLRQICEDDDIRLLLMNDFLAVGGSSVSSMARVRDDGAKVDIGKYYQ
jgi:hypothetical protein